MVKCCCSAAAEAHVVGEGAAGTLLAVSLLNPPDSAVKAVLSAGEKLVLKAGLSDDIPTYAERGASGKVAVVIKCKLPKWNLSL